MCIGEEKSAQENYSLERRALVIEQKELRYEDADEFLMLRDEDGK